MGNQKNSRRRPGKENRPTTNNGGGSYELTREQRIKENQLRMQKLGLLALSRDLNQNPKPKPTPPPPRKRKPPPQPSSPIRRSSRLRSDGKENVDVEINNVNQQSESEDTEPEPEPEPELVPEVYTVEHLNLLGDCKTSWTLRADGFDEDGIRITSSEGKPCHHCNLLSLYKIAGHITECSKCKSVQGQLCGDCLFTRYGENVMEANENKDWVCPACRGICNCSVCRRENGWKPTGTAITYPKVASIGFKSVAHYLIKTRGPQASQEGAAGASPLSREKLLRKLASRVAVKKTGSRKVARKRNDSDSEPDEEDNDVDWNEDAEDSDDEPDEMGDGLVVETECLV